MLSIYNGLILFYGNILAFAGLSFILMGFFKKINLSNKSLIIIAIILSIIESYLRSIDFGSAALNIFFGYFIGTNVLFGCFPLFNWLLFPIMGYIWGQYFIRVKDKSKIFKYWPIFICISLAYFVFLSQIPGGFISDEPHYYFMTIMDALFCLIYIHGNIGLCYYLSRYLPDKIKKVFYILSSNIPTIYIIQWIIMPLIIILFILFDFSLFNDLITTLISILVLIISTVFAMIIRKNNIKMI